MHSKHSTLLDILSRFYRGRAGGIGRGIDGYKEGRLKDACSHGRKERWKETRQNFVAATVVVFVIVVWLRQLQAQHSYFCLLMLVICSKNKQRTRLF